MLRFCPKCQSETERKSNSDCKPCANAYSTAWNAANKERRQAYEKSPERKAAKSARYAYNPEKAKVATTAWIKANPKVMRIHAQNYRAQKRANGGMLSKGLSAKLFKLQRGKCPCCKQPLGTNYHLDHIVPIALGGSNIDDNIQLLRQRCNNQKHAKDPLLFMQSRGFLL